MSRIAVTPAWRRVVALLLLAGATVSFTGCTPFTDFFDTCDRIACCNPGCDLSGCWEGYWKSNKSHHKGCLRGILTRCDDCHYHARFHATFFKFFSYEYEVTLNACPHPGGWTISGSKDLGQLAGGIYTYTGHSTTQHFHCRYSCSKDCGEFVMNRKACCQTACR